MALRDTLERLLWTVVSAFLGALSLAGAFDFDALEAAAIAAAVAGINFITLVARARLSVLPDPGAGLPGLSTGE